MVLDVDFLMQSLKEYSKEGVNAGLKVIQADAKDRAPVRKIFKAGRGKSRRVNVMSTRDMVNAVSRSPSVQMRAATLGAGPKPMSGRQAQNAGYMETGGWPAHYGRQVITGTVHSQYAWVNNPGGTEPFRNTATYRRTQVMRGGGAGGIETGKQRMVTQKEKIGGSIRGRVNSYSPVVQSPIGYIGGPELRHWSRNAEGGGVLALRVIRKPEGGSFNLSELLSGRGRYEVQTGRAVTTNESGQQIVGGRLRQGILIESAIVDGDTIYGYVTASAADPGRKHNYARDQEFGSRHSRPQPFLRPALRKQRENILNIERGAFKRGFEGAKRSRSASSTAGRPVRIVARISTVNWDRAATLDGFLGPIARD